MPSKPKGNPFEALAALRDKLRPTTPQVSETDFPNEPPAGGPARATLCLLSVDGAEKTVIEELGLDPATLEEWRLVLQRGLATSVTSDGSVLIVDGDHRLRLPDLLLRRGVQRVVQAR
ncbi:MAG: translation initiation factor [Myxococcaceae bacterium]